MSKSAEPLYPYAMKKSLILTLFLFFGLSSCNETTEPLDEPAILGTWVLSEILIDPGDGSGTYQPYESNKMIEFLSDGTLRANQNMCYAGNQDEFTNIGHYDLETSKLYVTNCHYQASEELEVLTFQIKDDHLFITHNCIEPCGEKYDKVVKE